MTDKTACGYALIALLVLIVVSLVIVLVLCLYKPDVPIGFQLLSPQPQKYN
jgi:hypothetical protein